MTLPSDITENIADRAAILMDELRHVEDDLEFTARVIMAVEGRKKPAPDKYGLSPRQATVLSFLKERTVEVEYLGSVSPTIREMSEGLGMTASRVHASICQLEERGFVKRLPHRARSLVVVGG